MITGLEKIWKFEVRFDLSNKKYIAILGYLGNDRKINIPKSIYVNYEEINVTTIEDNAFADCTDLTSITIPASVTTIGDDAFARCYNLTSITIPASVTTIGGYVFSDCKNLTSVTIPSGVTAIGDGAFSGCESLTSITLPSGLTSIGNFAFADCFELTSITIPASVTSVGSSAFCEGSYNVYYDNTGIPSTWKDDWKDEFQGKFYIKSETMPISTPNESNIDGYWHYVNGKPEVLI